jgi:hypothetical protein
MRNLRKDRKAGFKMFQISCSPNWTQIGCIKITRGLRFLRMDIAIEGPGRFGIE